MGGLLCDPGFYIFCSTALRWSQCIFYGISARDSSNKMYIIEYLSLGRWYQCIFSGIYAHGISHKMFEHLNISALEMIILFLRCLWHTIVMRFEVYFRCYRYLGRLLNLFNFIGIINYLWHMDDRHLVTRTPDRMLMHWRRMQMYITYMGMFWGKTLWLDVCVFCGVGSREP